MNDMAKFLIIIGVLITLGGVCLYVIGRVPWLGKLPGDIIVKKENYSVYIPITTCLLISLILSFLFFLWNQR